MSMTFTLEGSLAGQKELTRQLYRTTREVRGWRRSDHSSLRRPYVRVTADSGTITAPTESALRDVIESARWIVGLPDNWDEEGSIGYSKETFERVEQFVLRHASLGAETWGRCFTPPQIAPADHGSIDILWETESMQLLVNVPTDPTERISFYGEDQNRGTFSGQIAPHAARADLVAWIVGGE